MVSKYMLVNRYSINESAVNKIKKFAEQIQKNNLGKRCFYLSHEQDELIEFAGYDSLNDFSDDEQNVNNTFFEFKEYINGDIKRELLKYIESPLPSNTIVPHSKYVQLRHVEVLPSAYQAYLTWRDETIFNVVRKICFP